MAFPRAAPMRPRCTPQWTPVTPGYVDARTADRRQEELAGFQRGVGSASEHRRPGAKVTLVPDVNAAIGEVLQLVTSPGDGVVVNTPARPPFFATIEGHQEGRSSRFQWFTR